MHSDTAMTRTSTPIPEREHAYSRRLSEVLGILDVTQVAHTTPAEQIQYTSVPPRIFFSALTAKSEVANIGARDLSDEFIICPIALTVASSSSVEWSMNSR